MNMWMGRVALLFIFALTGCGGGGGGESNPSSVTSTAGTGGSISPESQTVPHGATATFTLTPDTGYSVNEVTGCGGSLDGSTYTTGAITRACTVAASFALNSHVAGNGYVAGIIAPDALNRVDRDTNDPAAPMIRNNFPEEAQSVLAPALIGGFVAAPGTHSRFGAEGDEYDVYRVDLLAGQQIVLEFPDSSGADLALYLLDEDGIAVDAAVGPAASLSLVPESAGTYFVAVRAYAGVSNYSLRLDTTHSLMLKSRRVTRVSDDFVPGEMIVRTRPEGAGLPEAAARRIGLLIVAGHPAREQLWRIPEGRAGEVLEVLSSWSPPSRVRLRWVDPSLQARYDTLRTIKALGKMPDMGVVSPNHIVRPSRLPNDTLQWQQWFHGNIDLPGAWDLSTGRAPDKEMIIAVVDTGVFRDHEDLQGKLLKGYDFIRMQPGGDDPGDSSQPGRSTWHGTHVAGIAAAATDNKTGVAGVSWGAKILPVRTLGEGGGSLYDTLQGIRYSAGLPNDSGTVPARRADVINLSLGGGTFVQDQADLYQEIRDLDIFVIAASGNNGGAVGFPAAYDAVFAVGATDAINRRAPYSSFGPELDFVAPGGDMRVDRTGDGFPDGILSTLVDDASGTPRSAYAFYQGTSMATAVASGVAALARSVDPELTPDVFAQLLVQGLLTDDIEPEGKDPATGWGQINALSTLRAVQELEDFPPLLSVVPTRLDFGFTETTLEFTLRNAGGGSLKVTEPRPSDSWLSVTEQKVDASGLGSYRVDVSREALADGVHEASIVVEALVEGEPGQELSIPVLLRKAAPELTVDTVGRLYVLLVNEDGDTIAEQGVDLRDGRYPYRFERVPKGEYRIVAGTDMNDDRRICDPGEACGAYPILGLFERVLIDRDRNGLDFSVGFRGQPVAGISALRRAGSDLPRSEGTMRVLP